MAGAYSAAIPGWVSIREQSQFLVENLTNVYRQIRASFPAIESVLPNGGAGWAQRLRAHINYFMAPKIYGRELQVSKLAVLVATVEIHKRLSA